MLKRKIIKRLDEWKNDPARKSLVIEGPQQIGKTFVLRAFAYEHYKQVVYINFNQFPYMRHIFEQDIDLDSLILQITLYIPGARCVPFETILLFDEIDYCPSVMQTLIKFSSDERYDVICTRTVLQQILDNPKEVTVIRMHALDYEEFLWANNVSSLAIQELRASFLQQRAVSNDLHQYFIKMFKHYMLVGGMPKAVDAFFKTQSFEKVQLVQRYINDTYLSEITSRIDLNRKVRALEIFHAIPEQVRKGNKKFRYTEISSSSSYRTHWESVERLYELGWLFTIFKVNTLDMPLVDNYSRNSFKLCVRDIGCLVGQLDDGDVEYLNEPLAIQKNILLENVVADILAKRGLRMFYMEEGNHYFFVCTKNNRKIALSFDDSLSLKYMNRLVSEGELDGAYDLTVEPLYKDKYGLHIPLYSLIFLE
jgi:uncharacterized protein